MKGFKPTELKVLFPLTWPQVFNFWRLAEAGQEKWEKHWTERGFKSWDDWRMSYAEPFKCQELEWYLYQVNKPLEFFPKIFGGPFRSWVENHYNGQQKRSFEWLSKKPEFKEHQGLQDLTKNFPDGTVITGIIVKGEIFIVEGMHRCLAISLMNRQTGLEFSSEVQICLAEYTGEGDLPLVGKNQK